MGIGIHAVPASTRVKVLDETQTERTSTILITLELLDRGVGGVGIVEANDARAAGATAGLILNLSLLYLTNSREELDEILIAGRPRELMKKRKVREIGYSGVQEESLTYVPDVNDLRPFSTRSSEVSERVGLSGRLVGIEARGTTGSSSEAATTAEATSKATAATTEAAATETAEGATAAAEAATTAETTRTHIRTGKAILANLQHTALPIVTIELLDGVASIIRGLEDNDTRSFRAAIRSDMNVGADNTTIARYVKLVSQAVGHVNV